MTKNVDYRPMQLETVHTYTTIDNCDRKIDDHQFHCCIILLLYLIILTYVIYYMQIVE